MNDDEEIPVLDAGAPCQLWHYVGTYVVSPGQVTPNTVAVIGMSDDNARRMVARQLVAVLEASKAINRMMDRPEFSGLNKPEGGRHELH